MYIITAALVVDALTALLLLQSGWGGQRVRQWYRDLRIGAFAMDVLSLVVCVGLTQALVGRKPLSQRVLVALAIQMIHDIMFASFLAKATVTGPLMKLFRAYSKEMGTRILWADALMVASTIILGSFLHEARTDHLTLGAAIAAYVGLLAVYSFD